MFCLHFKNVKSLHKYLKKNISNAFGANKPEHIDCLGFYYVLWLYENIVQD